MAFFWIVQRFLKTCDYYNSKAAQVRINEFILSLPPAVTLCPAGGLIFAYHWTFQLFYFFPLKLQYRKCWISCPIFIKNFFINVNSWIRFLNSWIPKLFWKKKSFQHLVKKPCDSINMKSGSTSEMHFVVFIRRY